LNAKLLEDDDELSDNDSGKHSDDSSDKVMTTEVSHLSKNDKLQLLHGFKKYSFHETDKILGTMPEKKSKIAGEILKLMVNFTHTLALIKKNSKTKP